MTTSPSRSFITFCLAQALIMLMIFPTAGQALLPVPQVPAPVPATEMVDVVVQLWDGSDATVAAAVVGHGGVVRRDLPVVLGFSATLPTAAVGLVATLPGVRAITPDALVLPQDEPGDSAPPSVFAEASGSDVALASGLDGSGATVALIDTGVSAVPDLADRLVTVTDPVTGQSSTCVNLSDEPGCQDSYGHGTFIAGLIAGDGTQSGGQHRGIAPGAAIVALKLSGRTGESNVSDVLAGIGWVIDNRDVHSIDVLNLSLRVDSALSHRVDPLNLAVQRAWAAGIVVVVSAGNLGPGPMTIAKPADDPWVISVGSTDDQGTAAVGDDVVSAFSSRGPAPEGVSKPDIVVSGRSLVSLRSPGSEADLRHPAFVDDAHRRGSGTSFSAGLVSGAAAVLLGNDPDLSPDAVKHAILSTGQAVASGNADDVGAGSLDVLGAVSATPGLANQDLFHPIFAPHVPASAEDLEGSLFAVLGVPTSYWEGSNWQGSNWQGSNWQGSNWQGSNWQGSNWQGSNWQGSNWQGSNWQSEYWE